MDNKITYTIWTDYGCEGWSPEDFSTKEEVIDRLMKGTIGPIRITCNVSLVINPWAYKSLDISLCGELTPST